MKTKNKIVPVFGVVSDHNSKVKIQNSKIKRVCFTQRRKDKQRRKDEFKSKK
jgi:hypothetical protein